jgi:hypothetical protein
MLELQVEELKAKVKKLKVVAPNPLREMTKKRKIAYAFDDKHEDKTLVGVG